MTTFSRVSLLALIVVAALNVSATAEGESASLADSISARLKQAEGKRGTAGCLVVDLDSGKTVASYNQTTLLAPASNMKVLTSAAALCTLGKDFEFVTRVFSRGDVKEGTLSGDLCIVGGGDPNISGRFYEGDCLKLFKDWAAKLKQAGIIKVGGDLLYDSTLFGGPAFCEGWPKDDQYVNWYCAEVSALAFNDNCVGIKVLPGKEGETGKIELSPATSYVKVVNQTKTIAGKGAVAVGIMRPRDANTFTVKGTVPEKSTWGYTDDSTVTDPALYAATVFKETLEACGIAVAGKISPFTMTSDELIKFTSRVEHRAKFTDALKPVNTNSQNLHAEMLFRHVGLAYAGKGSFKTGEAGVMDFLSKQEIDHEGVVILDGSGLSAGNRVTARLMTEVLKLMARREDREVFKSSLAVGGETGTLDKRMKDKLLKGRVFAKTGYIDGVHALSGYLDAGTRHYAFSMLMTDCGDAKDAMDDILLMLAKAAG
ncbi:MAG: D-alanyl-D-alanine carboxypeptidase/D-alanyl-D-alanine-endopeptidase [Planctomycetes bacterium]|nr:D-alanyl-D-alanine carboxypeptidase/D-alanyl-D-alanine-endopeptidase [Planctomycetota bacterium]